MTQTRNGGCGWVVLGFVLGFGVAQLTRPGSESPPIEARAPVDGATSMASAAAPDLGADSAPARAVTTPTPATPSTLTNTAPIGIGTPDAPQAGPENARLGASPGAADASTTEAADSEQGEAIPAPAPAPRLSDARIRALIVRDSLGAYDGSCPCPYNVDRGGRSCGACSAYSRPGGASPQCYPADVSDADVAAYRQAR